MSRTGCPAARLALRYRLALVALCLSSIGLLSSRPASANCEHILAGKSFWVRLIDPVASYSSKPGSTIHAVLIQSPECDGWPVFPIGLEVDGQITKVKKVGLGFFHDSASIEIQFTSLTTADGAALPMASQVVEIDNAREKVKHGVIHGIRSTDTPQGRITSRLIHMPTFNPYSDWGLIVYRAAFTILPEPEIYLPPGTDLRVQLNLPLYVGDQVEPPHVSFQMDEYERGDVEMLMEHAQDRTTTSSGKAADLINLLFVGSREQVQDAFNVAGWTTSDSTSKKSFFKQFGAFLTLSNYPTEPMSTQYLNGKRQDLTWQKSFDSYAKREHLRMWKQEQTVLGQTAWLGAYTRETGAALSVKYHKFIHHIDRNVDEGMLMLVRDLALAGCVESVRQLPRPEVSGLLMNATGDEIHTAGTLTVVQLKKCEAPHIEYTRKDPLIPARPHSKAARYLRTQVLIYKSDVIRGNIIYSAFDLARMSFHWLRHRHPDAEDDDGLPLSPISPETLYPQYAPGDISLGP